MIHPFHSVSRRSPDGKRSQPSDRSSLWPFSHPDFHTCCNPPARAFPPKAPEQIQHRRRPPLLHCFRATAHPFPPLLTEAAHKRGFSMSGPGKCAIPPAAVSRKLPGAESPPPSLSSRFGAILSGRIETGLCQTPREPASSPRNPRPPDTGHRNAPTPQRTKAL